MERLRWKPGHVMCVICFKMTPHEDLFRGKDGSLWDMCRECGEREHKLGE